MDRQAPTCRPGSQTDTKSHRASWLSAISWNDLDFAYNDNGEVTSKTDTSTSDVTSFTWSPFGKLETVTLPNSDVITYKYDGFGRKALVLLDGTVEYALLYESQLRPVAQMDSSGNLIARFVWGQKINTPEYMIKSGVKYRLVTDPRGSVRLVLKADDGTVAQRIDYNEWGEVTNDTSPGFQPFGYAGGLYDHRTGLTEFGARHYDASVGRFLSKDPILFAGGDTNLYGYVMHDPVNYIDPLGLYRYNKKPPYTVPVTGKTADAVACLEKCLQGSTGNSELDLLLTGGAEQSGHSKNSHHYKNQACDVAGPKFNDVKNDDVMSCASSCGFGAGQYEQFPNDPNRDHWHLQLTPGNGVPSI